MSARRIGKALNGKAAAHDNNNVIALSVRTFNEVWVGGRWAY